MVTRSAWVADAARGLGIGLLVGAIVGAGIGLWQVHEHRDLEHGNSWLAAQSMITLSLEGALWGGLVAAAIAARRMGIGLLVGALTGAGIGLWQVREHGLVAQWMILHSLKGAWRGGLLAAAIVAIVLGLRWLSRSDPRSIGVRSRRAPALAAAGTLVFLAVVGMSIVFPKLHRSRATELRSVILVSIDTMRADRLGVLGYARPVTPHFDRLAREGAVFEQATAAAPWTLPSHVSIFTSLLPFDHGVRRIGSRVPENLMLITERFRDAGYRTAAFTGGGYVSWGYGFDQGFEVYVDHDERAQNGPGVLASEALEWILSLDGEPFFVFVHTYEPHHPYAHDEFADPADAGRLTVGYENAEHPLTDAERRYAVGLYDSDVARADEVLGGMLEELRDEGILDEAILVVLSDHGEDFWDHDAEDIPAHGHTLYQELLHVPLLVRAPGIVPPGTRIRTPVSLLDVAPTLLELAGLPPATQFNGRSLAESCRTGREPEARPIVSESTRYGPDRFSVREGDLKVVVTPYPDRIHGETYLDVEPLEVFDLAADPDERFNRAELGDARELVDRVTSRALALLAARDGADGEEQGHPEALLEQLRSLGYID